MKLIILHTHIRSKPSLAIFIPFSCCLQGRPISSQRVLDIITPKPNEIANNRQTHLRVVENFLQTNSRQFSQPQQWYIKKQFDARNSSYVWRHENSRQNSILILCQLHKQGLKIDPCIVSNALSSCVFEKAFSIGTQLHCVAIVNGFVSNVYIGSSLITFYCKCKALSNAYKMFYEMPERNIVSWTTMINGFAQECQVDMCLQLYQEMRNLELKANDFTYMSFLAACMGSGFIGQGRSIHCQTIQVGFDSYTHVANALISMYCKCGDVGDAMDIFRNLNSKDLVSWNSMIAGYAQNGLAMEAIGLFKEMEEKDMKPDGITFLGILSSCRHAGLVKQGRFYLDSMVKYGVKPEVDHYSCIVDLLGRAGLVVEARDFIREMPLSPNAVIWGSLLSSSRHHGNFWIGIEAAENRLLLEPWSSATHLQLANLYACVGYWDKAAWVRKLMKERGLFTDPGCSWIEIRNGVYQFRADDRSNSVLEIMSFLDRLVDHMRDVDQVLEPLEEEIV